MNNIFSKKSNVVYFCFILFLLILICFFENKNLNDKTKILDTTNERITTTLILTTSEEDFFKIEEEEFKMLAKLVYREARGIPSKTEQAAVIWCVLNRVDSQEFPNNIPDAITQPFQFANINNTPVEEEFLELSKDVVKRWILEKNGYANVGRVLPKEYLYFLGDGKHNNFRKDFNNIKDIWGWNLDSPYDN